MAIEIEKIVSKLKEEGVDEKFGDGVSFETEEELNKWVDNIKTLAVKPKSIEEYTSEELETLLKDPQPKAKGLQAIADKIRTEARKKYEEEKNKKTPSDKNIEIPEDIKKRLDEIDSLKQEIENGKKEREDEKKAKSFDELFNKEAKGLQDEDKFFVKSTLKVDSTEEEVKSAIAKYKALMAKRGFNDFGADSTKKNKPGSIDEDMKASIERIRKRNEKK